MSDIVFKGAFGKVNGIYSHSKSLDAPAVLIVENVKDKNNCKKRLDFSILANVVFDIFKESDFSVLKFKLNEYSGVDKFGRNILLDSDSSQDERNEKRDIPKTRKHESDMDDVGFGDDMEGFAIDLNESGYQSSRANPRENVFR